MIMTTSKKKRKGLVTTGISLCVSLSHSLTHSQIRTENHAMCLLQKRICVVPNYSFSSQDDLLESEEEFNSDSDSKFDEKKGISCFSNSIGSL